jgi:tetratricopeptide (TPR) repeat protein
LSYIKGSQQPELFGPDSSSGLSGSGTYGTKSYKEAEQQKSLFKTAIYTTIITTPRMELDELGEVMENARYEQLRTICDHLVERTASLFLGSGINAGIHSSEDIACPLGNQLSTWICRDLLISPETVVPLDEASEMARHAVGDRVLNDYLFEQFGKFKPGVAQLALVQLPWDKIYTTNFDLLVEQAAQSELVNPAGNITVVTSTTTDVSVLSEEDIPYYKLHGSLDIANTADGKLILSKKDYREYEKFKKPLFKRLKADLESRTFVFVGYSLTDPNFRAVLDDCKEELGTQTLPLSFAVIKEFTTVQSGYWRDRYNIELISADAAQFMTELKDTWVADNCVVIPMLERKSAEFLRFDATSRFQKVGDSFYVLRTADCTGKSDPGRFFRGGEPTWSDIRDKVPAHRELYESILETMFPEFVDISIEPSAYVITGSAGTGKTTLLYRIAYDLVADFQAAALIHISGTPLDCRLVAPLVDMNDPRRFVIVVRFASEQFREIANFYQDAVRQKLPITLLLEDRTNQWHVAQAMFSTQFNPSEFPLGSLSIEEINAILDTLEKHDCLDKLTGLDRTEQVSHFNDLASEDLLVALRELTSNGQFDDIVRDEYQKIPSEIAKKAYVYVAAIGQLDLAVRYETIIRVLHLGYGQLTPELLNPTEGILIVGEDTGRSRHNAGFRLRARHPIIASIIFALAAEDDASKFAIINGILTELDPGYPEDMRLLREVMRRRELIGTLASHAMRRALFERLENLLPGDPYVWQHRSIIEREMQSPTEAVKFARQATKSDPTNPAFANTLGFALELEARGTDDALKHQALLSEASKIFEDGIKKNSADPYSYLGSFSVLRQRIDREKDANEKRILTATALSLLTDAYDETNESEKIAGELAKIRSQLGTVQDGINIVRQALDKKPSDARLRDLLIRFMSEQEQYPSALDVAREGARLDPTSWRLQRWLARLRQHTGGEINAIKGNYQAAIRHHKGDLGLMVEYAAFLFKSLLLDEAKAAFHDVSALSMSSQDRRRVRDRWLDADGSPVVFTGKIQPFKGAKGVILAVPENFEVSFWRTFEPTKGLREGESVRFQVGFTANGPEAKIANIKVSGRLVTS